MDPLDVNARPVINKVLMRPDLLMWTPAELAGTDGTGSWPVLLEGQRRSCSVRLWSYKLPAGPLTTLSETTCLDCLPLTTAMDT